MRYQELRQLYRNRDNVFNGYNSADGTTTDASTDAVITRNPNDFLVPKINSLTVVNALHITIGVLAVIILLPLAIKTVKSFI